MKKRIFALCAVLALALSLLSSCAKPGSNGPTPPKEEEKKVDLAAYAQELMEKHEFSGFIEKMDPADADMGAIMLENYLPGLTELEPEQMEVYMCMVSFNSGEFALVQAKSAEDAAKAAEIFQARIDSMTEEGLNYPETVELWANSARVVTNGSYVMLVCHEDADAITEEFNALFA